MYEKISESYPGNFPLTMEEKAKQMGYSLSRFKAVYRTLGLNYQKIDGRRRVMFE